MGVYAHNTFAKHNFEKNWSLFILYNYSIFETEL